MMVCVPVRKKRGGNHTRSLVSVKSGVFVSVGFSGVTPEKQNARGETLLLRVEREKVLYVCCRGAVAYYGDRPIFGRKYKVRLAMYVMIQTILTFLSIRYGISLVYFLLCWFQLSSYVRKIFL